jgi:Fic family protein
MDPYIPAKLPLDSIDWSAHTNRIGRANIALGEYKGVLRGIINPLLLLAPLNLRDAIISSRIEGTQTTMEEVMEFRADEVQTVQSEKQKNAQEVLNYCHAMGAAASSLESKPLCINTIRDTHRILLASVRGGEQESGGDKN